MFSICIRTQVLHLCDINTTEATLESLGKQEMEIFHTRQLLDF